MRRSGRRTKNPPDLSVGSVNDAQLFESALCDLAGQASYIATKASRLARAAGGRAVFVRDGSGALTAGAAS